MLAANTILLRLAHQFGVGEDAQLSQPVSVSLTNLFSTLKVKSRFNHCLQYRRCCCWGLCFVALCVVCVAAHCVHHICAVDVVAQITGVQEVSLTANQPVSALKANKMQWNTREADGSVRLAEEWTVDPVQEVSLEAPTITLNPLQVPCILSVQRHVSAE